MPVIEKQINKFSGEMQGYTARQNIPNYLYGNPWKSDKIDACSDFRTYIKLQKDFNRQVADNAAFENQINYALEEKMRISLDALLNLVPDNISLEISYDGSVYYKLLKDNYQIFFEHFLIDEFDDADEAIFTIYNGNMRLLNYGGNLNDSLNELNKFLVKKSVIEFA